MLKTIGKKFNRALHFDFHTPPGVENIFGNFDAEKFADQLAEAHVEYVNITARCNMGFSYYNTKVGKKYPGMGDRDPFGEILDAARHHLRGCMYPRFRGEKFLQARLPKCLFFCRSRCNACAAPPLFFFNCSTKHALCQLILTRGALRRLL